MTVNEKLCKNIALKLQATYVLDICLNRLTLLFYEEIKIKEGLPYISFCPLRILYNSKFILMAILLGTNSVVVTRVHCIVLSD